MIPYGRQDISQEDINAVVDVLKSDFLTQGPQVPRFEDAVRAYCGAAHAVAVNSATSALHIACAALGVGPGDTIWTSPITFVASANCGIYCGADVSFVDIDPDTFNICPTQLANKLKAAAADNQLPKAIVAVHMGGQSCDMQEIHRLAQSYEVRVIEDASHAIGGSYLGAPVGSCRYSDITVFSFHPVKIVTSAEGGMALTNDPDLAARMQLLRSHGITRDPSFMTQDPDGPWYYQQVSLGWNYRMTDMQAALGVSQLSRLDEFVAGRNHLADRYDSRLTDLSLDIPGRQEGAYSAFHLYIIRIRDATRRKAVFEDIRRRGVGVNIHYIPVHLQPYYAARGFRSGDYPISEAYYACAITLPIFPTMTEAQQDFVISTLRKAIT